VFVDIAFTAVVMSLAHDAKSFVRRVGLAFGDDGDGDEAGESEPIETVERNMNEKNGRRSALLSSRYLMA
jgi:hypothetical protein